MFDPSSGSQVHDITPGVARNRLFWTAEIPRGSFSVSKKGRRASLSLRDLCLTDTFTFGGPLCISALMDIDVTWEATGKREERGFGTSVPANDQGAFKGRFAEARCVAHASGREIGFAFASGTLTSDTFYAQLGPERNGVFL